MTHEESPGDGMLCHHRRPTLLSRPESTVFSRRRPSRTQLAAAGMTSQLGRTLFRFVHLGLKPINSSFLFWSKPMGPLVWLMSFIFSIMCRISGNGSYPLNPVRVFRIQRLMHHASRQACAFQTVTIKTFIGILVAVSFWSSFGKCETILVKHLDPIIEDIILGDYHRSSMLSENLFFAALLSVLITTVVLNLPFEDLEELISIVCIESYYRFS